MAQPPYNQSPYQHNMHGMPPLQTQHNIQAQRAYSPYQQSPGAMSPTNGGIPPAKRQRLSPQPMSPYSGGSHSQYNSPFSNSNPQYSTHTSPYATSPPANQYLPLPHSPAPSQPSTPSFHQPQPYQPQPYQPDARPPYPGAMLPPKVPASKAPKDDELEKSSAKDSNPNTLADVITGSGVDLDKENEALLQMFGSQGTSSTISPHGSFNQWGQQAGHGAFQGSGPLSQPKTKEQQEEELLQKHANVARIHNEAASTPLTDPFLLAAGVRHRMSKKVYEHGIKLDLEGLFDKIPNTVQNPTRRELNGSNGESVVELQATSLLNNGAPLVDLVSLVSLAAEERMRSVIEDAFALAQGRRNTAQGVVPPNLADIAVADGEARNVEAAIPNISKTTWEATDSTVSPTARLPTPPNDVAPAKQSTIQFNYNPVVNHLRRKMLEDEKFEQARIAKRQKRLQGNAASGADANASTPTPIIERPLTKKERDRVNKGNNTDEAVHARANETAALALGGKKKKYSWMDMGKGGGGGSGKSTPRSNAGAATSVSGTATPVAAQQDVALKARKREFRGGDLEKGEEGVKIQLRDLVHVLELDGRERKALAQIISRMRSAATDAKIEERPRPQPSTPMAR